MSAVDFAGTVEGWTTSAALVVGGLWSYLRFFRGRVFASKASPVISGEWIATGHHTVRIRAELSNVGSSKLALNLESSAIFVHTIAAEQFVPPAALQWERIAITDVFAGQRWVEAAEHISDEMVVDVGKAPGSVVMLELWVAVKRRWHADAHLMARCVVGRSPESPAGTASDATAADPGLRR